MNNERCYVIKTNVDGHLYCNYSTENLMTLWEGLEKLDEILEIDPKAALIRVAAVEKIDPELLHELNEWLSEG